MKNSISEVLSFVRDRESDVKFVRLMFTDGNGCVKNISISPEELPRAFEKGVEIPFGGETIRLIPDAATLAELPWRPQHGRVVRFFCEILRGGAAAEFDRRSSLKKAAANAKGILISVTGEFTLTKIDAEGNALPFDEGGHLDVYPSDRCENVRRDVCLYLQTMGVMPAASYHADGAGKNAIVLAAAAPLECADDIQTFRTVARAVAGQNGLTTDLGRLTLKIVCNGSENVIQLSEGQNPYSAIEELIFGIDG